MPRSHDPATARRILEERAEALARPLEVEDRTEMVGLVGLVVGGERYAVDLRHVIGIAPLVRLTPVPGTPRFWAGLAGVQTALRPILDLREYLGIAPSVGTPGTVVVVSGAGLCVGLLCDGASDVRWIPRRDIADPPGGGRTTRAVLRGVTPDMVAVLDLEALLADPSLIVDDEPL